MIIYRYEKEIKERMYDKNPMRKKWKEERRKETTKFNKESRRKTKKRFYRKANLGNEKNDLQTYKVIINLCESPIDFGVEFIIIMKRTSMSSKYYTKSKQQEKKTIITMIKTTERKQYKKFVFIFLGFIL